jgi:hypothetical protein
VPQPILRRIGLCAAAGVFLAAGAAGPALAASPAGPAGTADSSEARAQRYTGQVIARSGLLLRDAPTRGGSVTGFAPYNSIVHIFCKTRGQSVDGNDRWYLLTDGTWAWATARYIQNIGPAPRWC